MNSRLGTLHSGTVRSLLMAKAVTFVSLVLSVSCFVVLQKAGMPLGHIGKIMELSGTAITGVGLIIAWKKAAKRLPSYRQAFVNAKQVVQARIMGRGRHTTVDASETITVDMEATVLKQDGFAPTAIIDEKVYRLLDAVNEIRRELYQAEQRITEVAKAPKLTQQDADSAVAEALSAFRSDLEIHAVKDLTVAICGVLTTMIGIVLGMV